MDERADQRCLHRDGPFYLIVPLFYHTCSSPNHPDPSLPHCGSFPEHPIVSVVQSPCPAPCVSHTPAIPKVLGLTHLSGFHNRSWGCSSPGTAQEGSGRVSPPLSPSSGSPPAAVPCAPLAVERGLGWAGGSGDGPGSSWTGFYLVPPPAMDSLFSFVGAHVRFLLHNLI